MLDLNVPPSPSLKLLRFRLLLRGGEAVGRSRWGGAGQEQTGQRLRIWAEAAAQAGRSRAEPENLGGGCRAGRRAG